MSGIGTMHLGLPYPLCQENYISTDWRDVNVIKFAPAIEFIKIFTPRITLRWTAGLQQILKVFDSASFVCSWVFYIRSLIELKHPNFSSLSSIIQGRTDISIR